jgi:hypothetical protein
VIAKVLLRAEVLLLLAVPAIACIIALSASLLAGAAPAGATSAGCDLLQGRGYRFVALDRLLST